MGPDLSQGDLRRMPLVTISRRQYSLIVQSLINLTRFLAPIILKGKKILHSMWEGECKLLDWDDTLPEDVVKKISDFFLRWLFIIMPKLHSLQVI
jgi:hypothetical protein